MGSLLIDLSILLIKDSDVSKSGCILACFEACCLSAQQMFRKLISLKAPHHLASNVEPFGLNLHPRFHLGERDSQQIVGKTTRVHHMPSTCGRVDNLKQVTSCNPLCESDCLDFHQTLTRVLKPCVCKGQSSVCVAARSAGLLDRENVGKTSMAGHQCRQ